MRKKANLSKFEREIPLKANSMRAIDKIIQFRHYLLGRISDLTPQQLNYIPAGHRNNIIWNLAHMTAVLQVLCYVRSGLAMTIDQTYYTPFLAGTSPEKEMTPDEIATIKSLFITTANQLADDYERGIFVDYSKVEKIEQVYHIQVTNIDDAIEYLLHHEGFHYGCISSLKLHV